MSIKGMSSKRLAGILKRNHARIDQPASQAIIAGMASGRRSEPFVGPLLPPQMQVAHDLRVAAAQKPLPQIKRGRGRPSASSSAPVDHISRQDRRYRERMVSKAAEAWDRSTNGAGVVLVDGKPVPVKAVKS